MRRSLESRVERLEARLSALERSHVLEYPSELEGEALDTWLREHAPSWPHMAAPEPMTQAAWVLRYAQYQRRRSERCGT